MCTDDQLVARFREGDDAAFEALDHRYRPALLAYTRRMLGWSNADAEDALQEVLLRAYSALRRDDRPVTVRAWLYRIAHNYCVDQARRPAPAPCDVYDMTRPLHRDPVVEAEQRESLRLVVSDILRLPEQQRSALLMREVEGLRYLEIADVLSVSPFAVKSIINRARTNLVAADEARNAECCEIRAELDSAHERKVRMTGRSKSHLRDCAGCAAYKQELARVDRALRALSPNPGLIGTLAKVLGVGGAGSGVAAGGGAAGGGAAAGAGIAAKVTVILCCGAALVGPNLANDARKVVDAPLQSTPAPHRVQHARHEHRSSVLTRVDRRTPAAAAAIHVPVRRDAVRVRAVALARPAPKPTLIPVDRTIVTPHRALPPAPPGTYTSPRDAERQTGGVAAPDEPAPSGAATVRDAAPPAGSAVAAPDATVPPPEVHAKPQTPADPPPPAAAPTPPAASPAPAAPASGGTVAPTAAPAPATAASAAPVGAPTPAAP